MQPLAVRRVHIPIDSPKVRASVLLVTDDDDLRAVAAAALIGAGFEVEAVAHAGHALLACLGGHCFDALVTELEMPDMSGPMLAEMLRRHHQGLPVVYLANAATPPRDGVLVRPFTRDDLTRELTTALAAAAV